MKILVIGGSGLVGSAIVRRLRESGFDVIGTYENSPAEEATVQLDKTDDSAVATTISGRDPDVVIDSAAFHDVDECETRRNEAWDVNATGTRNVAIAAESVGAHFVFFSTDYVFPDDSEQAPYTESDPVNPINYYGQIKYAGEQATKIASKWTILRSSVIYGTSRTNFLTWVLDELEAHGDVEVVHDQVSAPTYADDLGEACVQVIKQSLTGLFHAAGPESLSRYEFACRLAEAFGHSPGDICPIPTGELEQRAPRPSDSSLDSTRLYDAIDYTFQNSETVFEDLCL